MLIKKKSSTYGNRRFLAIQSDPVYIGFFFNRISGFQARIVPTCNSRAIAIYQIMLGWKTCKYYHETYDLPNPRPTQSDKNYVKNVGHIFPQQIVFLVGVGIWCYIGNRPQETQSPTKTSANSLLL